ncbi:MAG: DUF4382 domain-containing protein [Bacteroidota bacterium]|nr:DUF4382 domain-containing protein [Bacteroidota bacterium]
MKLPLVKPIAFLAISALLLGACSREKKNAAESSGNPNKARLQIALTDDPGDYQAVFIDVREIKINMTSDTANGWQTLQNVQAGQYDLLKLVNDDDTILADVDLIPGRVHQIRLVLGPDNFVQIDNRLIRLEPPSAQQSGLKLNIQQDVKAGLLYKLTMDFDVAKSIVKTGNSKYILKPVIRTVLEAAGGVLQGYVKPFSFQTAVLVFRGPNDTVASTYSSLINGGYRVRGLVPGTYSLLFFAGSSLYRDSVITGINVANGAITVVDTMRLGQ